MHELRLCLEDSPAHYRKAGILSLTRARNDVCALCKPMNFRASVPSGVYRPLKIPYSCATCLDLGRMGTVVYLLLYCTYCKRNKSDWICV